MGSEQINMYMFTNKPQGKQLLIIHVQEDGERIVSSKKGQLERSNTVPWVQLIYMYIYMYIYI